MLQHVLSGGTTRYDKTIGTVVIGLVLYLVHVGVRKIGGFGGSLYALTYFPSLLLLVVLTGVNSDFVEIPFRRLWLWLAPLLLALYVCAALLVRFKCGGIQPGTGVNSTFLGTLWKNLSLMALMFIAVCLCGNSDRVFHYRLRVERLLLSGNFGAAWGLLSGQKIFLTLFALAALAAIFKFRRQLELERRPVQLAFGLLVGGIFGNLLDRLRHGYVVDFLDFTLPLIGYRWPAFNAADCGIVVGVGIFLVLNTLPLFGYNHPEAKRFNEEDALK